MLTLRAPAKLNLVLEVLGKRADGYHEIRSIVQTVDFCDNLELEPAGSFSFDCSVEALRGPENLVVRAARMLAETAGIKPGVRITLRKRIPQGIGLGGGSSDAAACLLGLNHLWGLGMPIDQLGTIGARLGSDVPFFLYGGTCLVEGRGERVIPMPDPSLQWMVLLFPSIRGMPEKTRRMYQALTRADFSDGSKTETVRRHIADGKPISADVLFNAFERAARLEFPGLSDVWRQFETITGEGVHLCGSGPALFSLYLTKAVAEVVVGRLRGQDIEAYAVRWLSRTVNVLYAGAGGGLL
ncbi:MAG: 4-(cytidine 5'-diphospho)-2-C-methyl-D-erythritol kinase [Chloroflexota bacterium]